MQNHYIQIELLDLWQLGSGKGEGGHLDSVPVLDERGLPFVTGREVKGLLRDAMLDFQHIMGSETDLCTLLYGTRSIQQTRYDTQEGSIGVSDARIPAALAQALDETTRPGLFHDVFSTAMDASTGTALNRSLRSMRTVVPITLHSAIRASDEHLKLLEQTLPLITALGSHRTRGLGRCVWTLHKEAQHG